MNSWRSVRALVALCLMALSMVAFVASASAVVPALRLPTTRAASATSCRLVRTASTTSSSCSNFAAPNTSAAALRRSAAALRKPRLRRADADRRPDPAPTSRTPPSASRRRSRIDDRTGARGDDHPRQGLRNPPHLRRNPRRHEFGAGYAGAQDRLFLMDVLRHTGRAELASFLGGSNAAADASQWQFAPYTEADLEKQLTEAPKIYGKEGAQAVEDLDDYVKGSTPTSPPPTPTRAEAGRVHAASNSRWNRGNRPTWSRSPRWSAASSAAAAATS